jgi:5-methylcytosine-specific restriction endonuclease McrA
MSKFKLDYYCKICNQKIGWLSGIYGSGLCRSCAQKGKKLSEETKKKIGRKGKDNKNYRRVTIICKQCNNKFEVRPCDVKKRQLCSLKCTILYHKGENNPNFNNNWSKKQKENQSIITKEAMTEEVIQKMRDNQYDRTGSNNPNYIDGRNSLVMSIRHLKESKQWKIKIFKRDNYTCQDCGQIGYNLNAHHEKSFADLMKEFLQEYNQFSPIEDKETLIRLAMNWKPFWEISNGKTLCEKCHHLKKEGSNNG